jgi:flap endonuclease-1
MGIKSFSDFLKRYAPNSYYEIPLESFRGKRIAIDLHMMIYEALFGATAEVVEMTNVAVVKPDQEEINQNTMNRILNKLGILMSHEITPICVFDGTPHPLKQQTQSGRTNKKAKSKEKLIAAEEKLYAVDSLLRTQPLMNEYRKAYKSHIDPGYEFYAQMKDVLISTGFPVLMAEDFNLPTNDAEAICAALCMPGNDYCVATITGDSDYHVYGGNLAITEYYSKYQTKDGIRTTVYYAKVRCLEAIMMQTGLNFEQFRDLCILMGTDFNPNISRMGPVKCWDTIRDYRSIDAFSQIRDTSVLNYKEVLKIFKSPITKLTLDSNLNFDEMRFREDGRETFDSYGLNTQTDRILGYISQS